MLATFVTEVDPILLKYVKISFTSPGNDYDSIDSVARYVIKYWKKTENSNLLDLIDIFDLLETEIFEEDLYDDSTLTPVNGSLVKEIKIKYFVTQIYFAIYNF